MLKLYCTECDDYFEFNPSVVFQTLGNEEDGENFHGKICNCIVCPGCDDDELINIP